MSTWDLTFIAMLLSGVFVAIITVAALYGHAYGYADSPCAPGRMANITASVQQRNRRIVMELELPAGWHDVTCFNFAPPTPARYVDDDPGELDEWIDEPELVPVPIPVQHPQPPPAGIPVEWPTRIVQPVPLPRR